MSRDPTRAALGYLMPLAISVGVLMLAGVTSIQAFAPGKGQMQLMFAAFGIAVFLAVQSVNYRTLLVLSPVLFALSLLPVLYTVAGRFTALPFVRPINGAYAWILFGPVSFQPAELTKICLILLLAWTLRGENESRSLWVLTRSLLLVGIAVMLIMMQPDLGTVLTLLPPMLVMVYLAGVRVRHLALLFILGLVISPVLWFSGQCKLANCDLCPNVPILRHLPQFVKHYQRSRVQALFSDDPRVLQDAGYQQERALQALGSGGLLGKGRGNIPSGENVPEPHTDMIIALIGEQFGLLGVAVVVLSYGLLAGTGLAIGAEHREQPGKLLAIGLVTLLVGQSALNLAVAFRMAPVTGLTLPFVSYGGSSLVASFLAVGILVNVARNQRRMLL